MLSGDKTEERLNGVIAIVALGMIIYHLAYVYYSLVGSIENRLVHLTFALVLIYLTAMKTSKKRWLLMLFILLSAGIMIYLWVSLERLMVQMGFPSSIDIIISFLLLAVVLWGCIISFGFVLPTVAVILLLYGYLGYYLGAADLTVSEIITSTCLTFGSYDLFGKILKISATVIFLFIVYGGLLQGLKATDFFSEIGKVMARYSRSGPAMTAVVSSALMGMTAGQTAPNIAITGSFTIPLMKKVGYRPEIAGSIEAAASGGGQIMPPIMAAGAFVMAELLNVSYSKVIVMATIPALIYFYSVGVFVHLHAIKGKVTPRAEAVNRKRFYVTAPLFLVPLMAILVLFFMQYPPMFAAFWGIVSLLGLSLLRKETRPSLGMVVAGCVQGATVGARVAVACATLGPIIAMMTKTGLGLTIAYSVESWCGGNVFLGLIILMFAIIVLGLEVPTVAAYLIAAIVAVPALIRLGLGAEEAHMFAFYFASFSSLTPPVGAAAIVASKLAEARYIKTALNAMNAAAAAYLIPFVFVFNRSLLLLPGSSIQVAVFSTILVLLGIGVFQIGFVGCFITNLAIWERALAVMSGLGFLVFTALGSYAVLFVSVGLLVPLLTRQYKKRAEKQFGEVSLGL